MRVPPAPCTGSQRARTWHAREATSRPQRPDSESNEAVPEETSCRNGRSPAAVLLVLKKTWFAWFPTEASGTGLRVIGRQKNGGFQSRGTRNFAIGISTPFRRPMLDWGSRSTGRLFRSPAVLGSSRAVQVPWFANFKVTWLLSRKGSEL